MQPTILHVTPPLVSFLTTHPGVTDKHMESVQHILPAAAPVGAALIQQFKQRFPGITVREGMYVFLHGYMIMEKIIV